MNSHTVERTDNLQQREAELEQQTVSTRLTGALTHELASRQTTLVLFCHPRNVSNLVESFTEQIAHAAGALPMEIRWSGTSAVLHQGVLLLEWTGVIPPTVLRDFTIDQEIFDVVVYEWDRNHDQEPRKQIQATTSQFVE